MCFASLPDEQNLALFNTINLHLSLLPVLQIKSRETLKLEFLCHVLQIKSGETLKLEFVCHDSGRGAENGCLGLEGSEQWGLFAEEMAGTDGYEVQQRVHEREGDVQEKYCSSQQ